MDITLDASGPVAIVGVAGRLTGETAGEFERKLLGVIETHPGSVLVDAAGLHYIGSAGIRVLFLALRALTGARRSLAFCSLDAPVRSVFEMVHLDQEFQTFPTRRDALEALARDAEG
jgi:anti-anti-sigma factor